jgi:hypothetical protein
LNSNSAADASSGRREGFWVRNPLFHLSTEGDEPFPKPLGIVSTPFSIISKGFEGSPKALLVMPKGFAVISKGLLVVPKGLGVASKPFAVVSKGLFVTPKGFAVIPKVLSVTPKAFCGLVCD